MLTRRDNLLIRPWQERRYIDHRNKVESALPAIDVVAPAQRQHVSYKMKKLQKEAERCAQIEQDNFTLLQHLRSIMKTNRLDNFWVDAPPNFLHRVGIYRTHHVSPPSSNSSISFNHPCTRKDRCLGCNPQLIPKKDNIPEERIPWEAPRPRVSRRESTSINNKTKTQFPVMKMKPAKLTTTPKTSRSSSCPRSSQHSAHTPFTESQSIILTHGGLKLAVNFPPNTTIILKNGQTDRLLQREFCQCGSMSATNKHTGDINTKV